MELAIEIKKNGIIQEMTYNRERQRERERERERDLPEEESGFSGNKDLFLCLTKEGEKVVLEFRA